MQIVGRRSSLFTRVALVFAHERGVPIEIVVVKDMTEMDPEAYGGNPALKLPALVREDGGRLFGAMNIARVIAEDARVVWPEDMRSDRARNAHEMLAHAMAAQIQLIMGIIVGKLDADGIVFAKVRRGLDGALRWLDENAGAVIAEMPPRDASWFEHALGCTVEHFAFRETLDIAPYRALAELARRWGESEAARATAYRFD
jgi:glutathione S-transferase